MHTTAENSFDNHLRFDVFAYDWFCYDINQRDTYKPGGEQTGFDGMREFVTYFEIASCAHTLFFNPVQLMRTGKDTKKKLLDY